MSTPASPNKYPKRENIPVGIVPGSVLICMWDTPWNFFVQKDLHLMSNISHLIQCHISSEETKSIEHPLIGQPCLAQFTDSNWYRARILDISPTNIQVYFADFGNIDDLDSSKILQIPDYILQIPELGFKCSLADVAPVTGEQWSPLLRDHLRPLQDALFRMEVISLEGDVYKVVLYLVKESNDICINGLLVKEGFARSTGDRSLMSEYHKNIEELNQVMIEHTEISTNVRGKHINSAKVPSKEPNGYASSSSSSDGDGMKKMQTRCHKTTQKKSEVHTSSMFAEQKQNATTIILQEEKDSLISSEAVSVSVPSNCISTKQQEAVVSGVVSTDNTSVLSNSSSSDQIESSVSDGDKAEEDFECSLSQSEDMKEGNIDKNAYDLEQKSHLSSNANSCSDLIKISTNNSVESRIKQSLGALDTSSAEKPVSVSVQSRLKQAQSNVAPSVSPSLLRAPVDILAAESPSCIFVRIMSEREKIERLIREMLSFYDDDGLMKESLNFRPEIAGRCAARSSVDSKWYRAIVLDIPSDDEFKVILKDVGRTEVVSPSAIRKLAPVFTSVRDGSIKCHLTNVKAAGDNSTWSSMACEELNDIIKKHRSNLYISKKGQISEDRSLPVLLWVQNFISAALEPTKEEWFTVNKYLVDKGAALPEDWASMSGEETITPLDYNVLNPSSDPDKTYLEYLEIDSEISCDETDGEMPNSGESWLPSEPFVNDEFVGIPTYVDNDAHVFIYNHSQDSQTMDKVSKRLNRMFTDSMPSAEDSYWFDNQMCSVKYHLDNSWYRGKVIKVQSNNKLNVLLVDYGNEETCSSAEVRKRVACRNFPVLARKCRVLGLEPVFNKASWQVKELDSLHNLLVDKQCYVKVLRRPTAEDDCHLVSIHVKDLGNIIDLLPDCVSSLYGGPSKPSTFPAVKSFLTPQYMPVTYLDAGPLNRTRNSSNSESTDGNANMTTAGDHPLLKFFAFKSGKQMNGGMK